MTEDSSAEAHDDRIYSLIKQAAGYADTDNIRIYKRYIIEYPSVYGNIEKKIPEGMSRYTIRPGCMVEELEYLIIKDDLCLIIKTEQRECTPDTIKAWKLSKTPALTDPISRAAIQKDILERRYKDSGIKAGNIAALVILRCPTLTMQEMHTRYNNVAIVSDTMAVTAVAELLNRSGRPKLNSHILDDIASNNSRTEKDPNRLTASQRTIRRAEHIKKWVKGHEKADLFSLTDVAYCPDCGARVVFKEVYETDRQRHNVRPTLQYILRHLHTPLEAYKAPNRVCRTQIRYSSRKDKGFKAIKKNNTQAYSLTP